MLPQIDTGYKPEFALGALYHGMNAANTQQSAEMELIKQFLANNREEQMQPMEVGMKGFDFAKQQALHNNPNYLPQFVKGQIGDSVVKEMQGNEATRKGELGNLLQPFAKQQIPIEQGTKTTQLQMQNELAQIDQLLGNGGFDQFGNQATPEQMKTLGALRQQIVDRMGQTPELSGKIALEHIKGQYGLDEARLRGQYGVDAANAAGQQGGRAAWAQAIGPATQLITQTQNALARLNSNEMDEQLAGMLATRGLKRGTEEFEAALKSEKDILRTELNRQLTEGNNFLQEVRRASGLTGLPPTNNTQAGTAQNPIKLN